MENQRIGDFAQAEPMAAVTKTTTITGEINGQEDLRLDGRIDGKIRLKGLLFIGRECFFSGHVEAENVIIEGRIEGQVKATGKIEIRSTGQVQGNIFCQQITIAEGAALDGKVINKNGQPITPSCFIEKRRNLEIKNKPG